MTSYGEGSSGIGRSSYTTLFGAWRMKEGFWGCVSQELLSHCEDGSRFGSVATRMEGQMVGQMHLTFWVAVCEAILTVMQQMCSF